MPIANLAIIPFDAVNRTKCIKEPVPAISFDEVNSTMRIEGPVRPISFDEVNSREELKKWLKQFDIDKDGRISRQELRQAIQAAGIYKHIKLLRNYLAGRRGVRNADINRNGFVDEDELDNLVDFVAKIAGLRFIPGK